MTHLCNSSENNQELEHSKFHYQGPSLRMPCACDDKMTATLYGDRVFYPHGSHFNPIIWVEFSRVWIFLAMIDDVNDMEIESCSTFLSQYLL